MVAAGGTSGRPRWWGGSLDCIAAAADNREASAKDIQIFGSIFGVAARFVCGKEGPMVHTGACIANLLGHGGSRKYYLTWKWLRFFKNDRDLRDLITCGAAAGVAATFRAPVGGDLITGLIKRA